MTEPNKSEPNKSEPTTSLYYKWIKALRSGDYQQGRTMLNSDGEFCCLGVLCEVAKLPTKKPRDGSRTQDFTEYVFAGSGIVSTFIPEDWLKSVVPFAHQGLLVTLNDTCHLSFEEIADVLEETKDTGLPMYMVASDMFPRHADVILSFARRAGL